MIFDFLFPILGWLLVFIICYVIYVRMFYKESAEMAQVNLPGQALYGVLAGFFWITVYMCLSSVWSILYALIDLKYPDVIGAVSDYGSGGFSGYGVVYDAFAFPLAMTLVSAVTACVLAFFLINKFQENKRLRPEKLYHFLRALVFIGGAVLAFSGFVYVVYSWLYGNLPIAVFYKGLVAFVIVGGTALYFYLTGDGRNPKESLISKIFASLLVIVTLATLYVSFQVIGTPAEARKYRLDNITIQVLQEVKREIDERAQSFGQKIASLSEIQNNYVKNQILKMEANNNPIKYSSTSNDYSLCANFNADTPKTINTAFRDTTWDYKAGEHCFTFPHLPPYPHIVPNLAPKNPNKLMQ